MLLTSREWVIEEGFSGASPDALVDYLLRSRGITTEEQKKAFLGITPGEWHDPFLFADMDKAVSLICDAIQNKKRILIYGDYDCDGVTATAIFVRYLRSHGAIVNYLVPHRAEHGYGLTVNILDKVLKDCPELLITVDCGITNFDTISELREKGIKVILSDHHNVKESVPDADAVICAKREDNTYPFRDLCGAGVAMKIVEAMGRDKRFGVSDNLWKQIIELAGIATIADLVPIAGENRTIIKQAFISMRKPSNPGVRVMLDSILEGKILDEGFISFNFVPRINAAGRLYDSSDALKLFIEDDKQILEKACVALGNENDERKKIEASVFEEAKQQLENPKRSSKWQLTNIKGPLVVYGPNWHQGVLGIVAGKLSMHYGRSAIVLTNDQIEKSSVKGSGRSFGDFDLFQALTEVSDTLENFGGHKKAAGVLIKKDKVSDFMEAIENYSENLLQKDEQALDDDSLTISAKLPFDMITFDTYKKVNQLKPFGMDNKKPVFASYNLLIVDIKSISDGQHIKLDLIDDSRDDDKEVSPVSCIGFGKGKFEDILQVGDRINIAYTMGEFIFKGSSTLSLNLEDIVPVYSDQVWNRLETIEKLYRSQMEITQLAKLAGKPVKEELYPKKEDYIWVYRTITESLSEGVTIIDVKLLTRIVESVSRIKTNPFKVLRCLSVFAEVGLISLNINNLNKISFFVKDIDTRMNLKTSPLYNEMNEYEG